MHFAAATTAEPAGSTRCGLFLSLALMAIGWTMSAGMAEAASEVARYESSGPHQVKVLREALCCDRKGRAIDLYLPVANAEGERDRVITPHQDYLGLGDSDKSRRDSYRALFKAHLDPEVVANIRRATNGNYVFGPERFQEEVGRMLQRRVVPGKAGRPEKTDS